MDAVLMFCIFTEIPSHPWALFAPNDWTIFSSFSLLKVISFSLFYVWYELYFRRALLFCRGWHCLRKNYFSKLVINLSFTSRGRIIGVFAIDEGFKYRPKGFWWRRWISWFGGQLAMECSLENLTNHLQPLVIARNRS